MTTKIAWAAALLLSTAVSAYAQTPAASSTMASPASQAATPDPMPGKSAPMAASKTADLSKSDKSFVAKAASGGMAEVQAAQLAEQKTQDSKVKEFAEKMVADHTPNNKQLASLAEQKGVEVPAALDSKDQKQLDKLSALDGAKFDKAYLKAQVKDHEAMLKLLQREAKSGKDADLKSFAEQTIPVVQEHLTLAKTDSQS
jgi:putative membrane protein